MSNPALFRRISAEKTLFYTWFEAMHTRIDVAFCNLTEEKSRSLDKLIRETLKRLDKMLNRFDTAGEIALVNRKAGKEKVTITDELFRILRSCLDYNQLTQGYFDITIHSFNGYRDGIRGIILDEKESTVSFAHPDIQIDLGGFGKGYALDQCRTIVANHQCQDALLSFGNSSILAMGSHPMGTGWKISLENRSQQSVLLDNECLTTSGHKSATNKHIRSPLSGKYIENTGTISVKTINSTLGEVLSTALFAALNDFPLHFSDSRSLLEYMNFHALMNAAIDIYISIDNPSYAI